MILKEIDEKIITKDFEKYGHDAEKQMSFYLKRAFQSDKEIHVINDLRLKMNDDVAQIDHLIFHRYGFLIVESKSVTSKISINEFGEWTRHYPKFSRGMPSPINQVKTQLDFLKTYLTARSDYLLKKRLLMKFTFNDFKFDLLIAISDSGIINRDKNIELNEVYKADQIPHEIKRIYSEYEEVNKTVLSTKVNYGFADETIARINRYLLDSHLPKVIDDNQKKVKNQVNKSKVKENPTTYKPEKETEITKEAYICSKCSSENIQIAYGRYGYYFKCDDCDGSTSIKLKCKSDSCNPKVRKKKTKYYKDCPECNTSVHFFTNAE